jgi:Ca-activated chloride channel family protein
MGVLKDGTAIGDGLALAVNRLRNSKAKSRIIVLLTDGDSNVGQVSPATAGDLAAGYGIKVYTIAIGREGKVKLPIRHKNAFGQVVTSYQMFDNALNPELLKLIADKTGGKFYRVTEGSALESVFKEIDTFEKQDYLVREKTRYEEHFFWPLVIGFLLLLFEQVWAFAVVRFAT